MTANLSNWRSAPYHTTAFVNIDKILDTHVVSKAAEPSQLLERTQPLDGFLLQDLSREYQDFDTWLSKSDTDGILVLKDGDVVHENYRNGNDRYSRHILMSMTKSIAGLVVGILASQGKLDINSPIHTYVPEASQIWADATIRDCLDMRSGVAYQEGQHAYRAASGWDPLQPGDTFSNLKEFLSQLESPTTSPGEEFFYASVNVDLIGWVIERATGKTVAEVVTELLWKPMGAESDAWLAVDSKGLGRMAGGICATVRDLGRIGQMIVDGGKGIVPEEWLQDIAHHGDTEVFARGPWKGMARYLDRPTYRSYFITESDGDLFYCLGIHGQCMLIDRINKIVIVKMSSQASPTDSKSTRNGFLGLKEIRRTLLAG